MSQVHEHTLHLDSKTRHETRRRLLSVRGHTEGILKMLEGNPYCIDVLRQIKAVEGALDKVGELVLQSHLKHHVTGAAQRGDADQLVEELMEVLKYR